MSLPAGSLYRDQNDMFTRSPDSDSDEEDVHNVIRKSMDLFTNEKMYLKNEKDGVYYAKDNDKEHHPLMNRIVEKNKRKIIYSQDAQMNGFERSLRDGKNTRSRHLQIQLSLSSKKASSAHARSSVAMGHEVSSRS